MKMGRYKDITMIPNKTDLSEVLLYSLPLILQASLSKRYDVL